MPRFDRLRQIHNFLLDLPHSKFHMPYWVARDYTHTSCGSAGCFGGWTATVFNKEGWKIDCGIILVLINDKFWSCGNAISIFYEIPLHLAVWICCSSETQHENLKLKSYEEEYGVHFAHVTPTMVADRVHKVIEILGGSLTDHDMINERKITTASANLVKL